MFERMEERVRRRARAAVRRHAADIAESLREKLPDGAGVEADEDGVRLSGRALRRRMALEPALRVLPARLR